MEGGVVVGVGGVVRLYLRLAATTPLRSAEGSRRRSFHVPDWTHPLCPHVAFFDFISSDTVEVQSF